MSLKIRKEAWLLIIFSVLCSFGVAVVFPYIPIHGKDLGIPISIIGQLVVIYYILQAITRVPLGKITDLFGYHQPVLLGSLFYMFSAVSFLASFFAWPLLFIGELFLGIANSVIWVTIPSYISDIKQAIPLYGFSMGVGWLVGSPAGGYIKDSFGMNAVFLTLLLVSVFLIVLASMFIHFQWKRISEDNEGLAQYFRKLSVKSPDWAFIYPSLKSYSEVLKQVKENKDLLIISLFSFLIFMTFGLGASLVPVYLSSVGISSFLIGMLISIRMSTVTLVRMANNQILGIVSPTTTLVFSTIIAALSLIVIALTESFIIIVIMSTLWGLGLGLYLPIMLDIIGKTVDKSERGIAMGARGTLGTFGAAIGTWVFSAVAGVLTVSTALVIAGFLALVGSLVLGYMKYYFRSGAE